MPAIVVLAYRRPHALRRLLSALQTAEYEGCVPTLVISIEGDADPEVIAVAEAFQSDTLCVQRIHRSKPLGLRRHVIACGDLSEQYGSIIVLEDDLLVDRFFYRYASAALTYYQHQSLVSGIALYSYEINELTGLPFVPMANGHDTYFMQVACSWGQCWTHQQWSQFKAWYNKNGLSNLDQLGALPRRVKRWPKSSWKKYFYAYLVEQGTFVVYPYQAYSTNCSDPGGTHIVAGTRILQVALAAQHRPAPSFHFAPTSCTEVRYDAFFEPAGDFVFSALDMSPQDLEIDLQGTKPLSLLLRKPFVLTIRKTNHWLRAFRFEFRPPEMNVTVSLQAGDADFWLCRSETIDRRQLQPRRSIGQYSYFSRMHLMAGTVIFASLRALPRTMLRKLLHPIRKFVGMG